jgi:hypothetical protein
MISFEFRNLIHDVASVLFITLAFFTYYHSRTYIGIAYVTAIFTVWAILSFITETLIFKEHFTIRSYVLHIVAMTTLLIVITSILQP